jgi:anti-sigma B factor antagonist
MSIASPPARPADPTPPATVVRTTRPPTLGLDLYAAEGVSFLSVTGDIDIATADQLRHAGDRALNSVTGTLRIDLAGVGFVDSSGVNALVAINERAIARRSVLIIDNAGEQVRRVLQLCGLDQVLRLN